MNLRLLSAAFVLALAIGSVGPWVTASVGAISVSSDGLDGDGAITLAIAVLVAVLLALHAGGRVPRAAPIATIVLGALSLLICAIDTADAAGSSLGVDTGAAWGLWLALIASAGLTAAGIGLFLAARARTRAAAPAA